MRRPRRIGDDGGLVELTAQRGDRLCSGPGDHQPLGDPRAFDRQSSQFTGEHGVAADRLVDLGDRRHARGHVLVGGLQPFGRSSPFPGGPTRRREVASVFLIDPVDQQGVNVPATGSGVTKLAGPATADLTGHHVERAGQRVASRQIRGCGRRRLQHPLRLPQIQVDGLGEHGPHPVVGVVTGELLTPRR